MKKFGSGSIAILMLCALMASISPAAGAQAEAVSSGSLSCSVQLSNSIPTVSVETTATSGRVVIERKAFSRHWWRGAIQLDQADRVLVDGPLPKNASLVEYRAVLKANNGEVLGQANCELVNSGLAFCRAIATVDGYATLALFTGPRRPNVDTVYRRSVTPDGPNYWRGVVPGRNARFTDGPSPTGVVTYQAFDRSDGVIFQAATCTGGTRDLQCVDIDPEILVNPRESGQPFQTDSGFTVTQVSGADGPPVIAIESPNGGPVFTCGPDGGATLISVSGDRVIFVSGLTIKSMFTVVLDGDPKPASISPPISRSVVTPGINVAAADGKVYAMTRNELIVFDQSSGEPVSAADFGDAEANQIPMVVGPDGVAYFTVFANGVGRILVKFDPRTQDLQTIGQFSEGWGNQGRLEVLADGTVTYTHCGKDSCSSEIFEPVNPTG